MSLLICFCASDSRLSVRLGKPRPGLRLESNLPVVFRVQLFAKIVDGHHHSENKLNLLLSHKLLLLSPKHLPDFIPLFCLCSF